MDVSEFRKALWQLGFTLSDKQFAYLLALVDADNSGEITYSNFAAALARMTDGEYATHTAAPSRARCARTQAILHRKP